LGPYLTSGVRFRSEPLGAGARVALWLLLAVATSLLLVEAGHTPFFEPDEARYAEIPREMLAAGDFVAPHLNGHRAYEKPPLHYWAVAASMKAFGETEMAARLPAKLSAVGMVLALAAIAAFCFGERVAILAGLIVATSLLVVAIGRLNIIDGPLSFAVATSAFAFASFQEHERSGARARVALYLLHFSCAAAVMLKGLVGLVLPGGAILVWALLSRRLAVVPKLFSALPLLVFLALTAAAGAVFDRRTRAPAPAPAPETPPKDDDPPASEPDPSPAPAPSRPAHISRRDAMMRVSGVAAWGMTGSLLGWGMVRGRHAFAVEEVVVRIARLPKALDGYTIAQVSDIHCGPFRGERELGEAFELVRGIKPDLVVATGDLVDFDAAFTPLFARRFADLPSRDGRLAILGNHDYYAGARIVRDHLAAAGVEVLVNESRILRPKDGGGIALVGVDDMWSKPDLDGALAGVGKDLPKVLLAHQPRFLDFAAGSVDLQLSGHTHGGQICLPGGVPLTYNAKCPRRLGRGPWRWGEMQGYTSAGAGSCVVPVRFNCPPEITLHQLLG